MVIILLVLGFLFSYRASANLWDALTDSLYAWHKLIGFSVLLMTSLRIVVKLLHTTPNYPIGISPINKQLARVAHCTLYLLLMLVPLLGWAGVTAYPALMTWGGFNLPAMPGMPKDEALAKQLFEIHGNLVLALIAVSVLHISAALHHLWIRKDQIFDRIGFKSK
jgi:cytochrome b561